MCCIEGLICVSVGIMKEVNLLIWLLELIFMMREVSMELMKVGIIEEMVDDVLLEDGDMEFEGLEVEGEVDKVFGEIFKRLEEKEV